MKKTFKNNEIESILTVINSKDSFIYNIRMPAEIRQALRVNRKVLMERMEIYQDGKNDILESYIKNGHATREGSQIHVDEQYQNAIVHELRELAAVNNELDFEGIPKDVLENFLNSQQLTMAEEDALLLFMV